MMGVFDDISNITKTLNKISSSLFNFISNLLSLFIHCSSPISRVPNNGGKGDIQDNEDGARISDIKMVMSKLGMNYEVEDDEKKKEFVSKDEFEGLFGEEEPSMGEIREVFEVFDENKDGYIDAIELSKVLSKLGLMRRNEEHNLERCRKMLKGFDRYGVGLLDFDDFVKFMEMILC